MSNFEDKLKLYTKNIGNRVKKLRLQKSLTKVQLAVLTEMEVTAISRIENDKTNLSLKKLLILAESLEVYIIDFFDFVM